GWIAGPGAWPSGLPGVDAARSTTRLGWRRRYAAGWPPSSPAGAGPMEDAVSASTAGSSGQIVVADAGYAGLHVTLRLTAKLRNNPKMELTLVDRHDYHQVLTELPRVAGGTRAADAVRIPLQDMLAMRVRFVQTEINGFD